MREDVIRAHAELPALCEHIHLPLQSGSSRILKAMRRTYDRERYLDRVAQIREHVPDCALTTDIIVGFPGETEEDFAETLEVVDEVGFDGAFTFIFSPAPGHRGGDAAGPGPAPGEARADGAPRRAGPAAGPRARAALRRPQRGGARRGAEPNRRDAACAGGPATTRPSTSRAPRPPASSSTSRSPRDLDDARRARVSAPGRVQAPPLSEGSAPAQTRSSPGRFAEWQGRADAKASTVPFDYPLPWTAPPRRIPLSSWRSTTRRGTEPPRQRVDRPLRLALPRPM